MVVEVWRRVWAEAAEELAAANLVGGLLYMTAARGFPRHMIVVCDRVVAASWLLGLPVNNQAVAPDRDIGHLEVLACRGVGVLVLVDLLVGAHAAEVLVVARAVPYHTAKDDL